VAPMFVVPVVATVMYKAMQMLFRAMVRHTDSRIAKVNQRSEKILHGLKDDMKFDRTEKLLRKYDREWMGHNVHRGSHGDLSEAGSDKSSEDIPVGHPTAALHHEMKTQSRNTSTMSLSKKLVMSTVGGASMKLSSALAQLWTLTADTVVGDDPALLRSLKNAEIHAQTLTEENARLREKLERYEGEFGILYNVGKEGEDGDDSDGEGHEAHEAHEAQDITEESEKGEGAEESGLGSEDARGDDEDSKVNRKAAEVKGPVRRSHRRRNAVGSE
jgi:hypothetical protein